MHLFKATRNFRLMHHRKRAGLISMALVLVCVVSLATRNLNYSVDFTGGTLVEISLSNTQSLENLRSSLAQTNLPDLTLQFTSDGALLIKARTEASNSGDQALQAVQALDPGATLRRVEYVGPQVSAELFTAGALALLIVCAGIMLYLSVRFKWRMAIGAIVANFHDVVFILGAFSLFGWDFSLPVLAAVLAILGYSVNESVVIFDRVRENLRSSRATANIADVIDASITQTWSRTIITHGSTQLAVLAMLLFGGDALFYFALALTIGILSSIYSSILIASPIALSLGLNRKDFIGPTKRDQDGAIV